MERPHLSPHEADVALAAAARAEEGIALAESWPLSVRDLPGRVGEPQPHVGRAAVAAGELALLQVVAVVDGEVQTIQRGELQANGSVDARMRVPVVSL